MSHRIGTECVDPADAPENARSAQVHRYTRATSVPYADSPRGWGFGGLGEPAGRGFGGRGDGVPGGAVYTAAVATNAEIHK